MDLSWSFDLSRINWSDLSELIRIAPLSDQPPEQIKTIFSNSQFFCFVFHETQIVGAGRILSDGLAFAYLSHIAVHPDYQGMGLGKKIVRNLIEQSKGHSMIILYSNPGLEGFYYNLGFKKMKTAMAIFENEEAAIEKGVLSK